MLKPWIRTAPVVCGTLLSACVSYPKATRDTPYEGNVSPVDYQHVSGAPEKRTAAGDAAQIIASGAMFGTVGVYAAAGSQHGRRPASSGLTECRAAGKPSK